MRDSDDSLLFEECHFTAAIDSEDVEGEVALIVAMDIGVGAGLLPTSAAGQEPIASRGGSWSGLPMVAHHLSLLEGRKSL